MRGYNIISKTMFGNESWNITTLQQQICIDAQEAIKTPSKQMEDRMLAYHWKDYLAIITNEAVPSPIRIVSLSAAKNLVYNKKFVDDPEQLFLSFLQFYLGGSAANPSNIQALVENILRALTHTFFTERAMENCYKYLLKHLEECPESGVKVAAILDILVEGMEPETLNNEVIVGEVFLFFQSLLPSPAIGFELKALMMTALLKVCESIIDYANTQDEEDNIPELHLRNSQHAKSIL